ncbi:MAG TPA: alpha/beta hydrolase [Acidimicrobiales bacterium]|nr:alpha/beta hydrolase [Acidimicrobiales bacterium]
MSMGEVELDSETDDGSTDTHDAPPDGAVTGTSQSVADRITGPIRAVAGFLHRRALIRATRAIPRTFRFVGSALLYGEVADSLPAPHLSVGLAAQVAMDEALLAMAMTPRRFPLPGDYARVAAELAHADALYSWNGWIEDPLSYHRTPPPLAHPDVTESRGWAMGLDYDRLSWDSGFEPHPGEPGSDRWMAFEPNRTASAVVLRHPGEPRPWVVAVHGFCMGFPFMDFQGLQIARIHRELGMNVAMPALPLHGPRRVTLVSGEPFLSFELMNAVHGLTQAVWDIRRLIEWVREQGATSISLYGVSLGAYTVSLVAGIEEGIDAVVAGIPVSDFPGLFHRHSPRHIRARSIEHKIMGGAAENVYRVVSPLRLDPNVPKDRRFIFAGYGDRLARPEQAQRLWEHWDRPRISWYAGNHVGYLWSKQVSDFLVASLRESSMTGAAEAIMS